MRIGCHSPRLCVRCMTIEELIFSVSFYSFHWWQVSTKSPRRFQGTYFFDASVPSTAVSAVFDCPLPLSNIGIQLEESMTVCVERSSGVKWQSKTSGVKVVSFCRISTACTKALSSRRVKVCTVFHGLLEDCMPTTGAHTRSPLQNKKKF